MTDTPSDVVDRVGRTLFRLSLGVFLLGGFLTVLVSMIVPRLTLTLRLDYAHALLVQVAFHLSYLLFAMPITHVIVRIGYMRSIATGLGVMMVGCIGLIGAADLGSFGLVLLALLTLSSGITFLQIAANTVVTVIGSSRDSVARLTLLQGFNSLGTVLAPLIGAQFMLRSAAEAGQRAIAGVAWPFVTGALGLGVLALAFARQRNLLAGVAGDAAVPPRGHLVAALRNPRLRGGVIAMFAYVGAEVAIGTLMANYLMLPRTAGADPLTAGRLVTFYWMGAMIGRFGGAAALQRFSAPRLLAVVTASAMLLTALAATIQGIGGAAALIAVGLCNAIMYPTIFTLALPDDSASAPDGSMLLCMAVVGGAVVPLATGLLADRIGLAPSLLLPTLCYAVILMFAWRVSRYSV